jgi:hypothetical protein
MVDIKINTEKETNEELKRIHEESVKKTSKITVTGKSTATYYQEIYEMGVEDKVIIEEDDGYPD